MKPLTDHDQQILSEALAYAVALIDALPVNEQLKSDQADMKRLLDDLAASDHELEYLQGRARQHLQSLRRGKSAR